MNTATSRTNVLPELSDPRVAQKSVLFGFSFSVTADGSPGRCNQRIAQSIQNALLNTPGGSTPSVGLQWEVCDALDDLNDARFQTADYVPPAHIAALPEVTLYDITNQESLFELLISRNTPADQQFMKRLERQSRDFGIPFSTLKSTTAALVKCINAMLDDRQWYKDFQGLLDLHDNMRENKHPIGLEKRTMPRYENYPSGLRRFQARRVNRLVMEAIVPECFLRRGGYLNTAGVANYLIGKLPKIRETENVFIYCHPVHRSWCEKMTRESFVAHSLDASSIRIYYGDTSEWEPSWMWDRESAQVWCRSYENWEAYKNMQA